MKNNRGWGISEMFALVGILLFFFLLVIVLIINFYKNVVKKDINVDEFNNTYYYNSDNSESINSDANSYTDNSGTEIYVPTSYEDVEVKLENAAEQYLKSKYSDNYTIESVVISVDKLINAGYYSNQDYEDCNGYVNASMNGGVVSSKAYIKCDNYITEGYGD